MGAPLRRTSRRHMQATDAFSVMPVPGAAQPQGGGGRGVDASGPLGGLFAPAESTDAAFGDADFAEALMAALMVVQPQTPIQDAPVPTGEGAQGIEGLDGK